MVRTRCSRRHGPVRRTRPPAGCALASPRPRQAGAGALRPTLVAGVARGRRHRRRDRPAPRSQLMMHTDTSSLALRLHANYDAAAEDLEWLTARLRLELLELDVADVRRAEGSRAPDGARAVDVAELGSLVV